MNMTEFLSVTVRGNIPCFSQSHCTTTASHLQKNWLLHRVANELCGKGREWSWTNEMGSKSKRLCLIG